MSIMPPFVHQRTEIEVTSSGSPSSNGIDELSSPVSNLRLDNYQWYPASPDIIQLYLRADSTPVFGENDGLYAFNPDNRAIDKYTCHSYNLFDSPGPDTGYVLGRSVTTEGSSTSRSTERLTLPEWQLSQYVPVPINSTNAVFDTQNGSPLPSVMNTLECARGSHANVANMSRTEATVSSNKKAIPSTHPGLRRGPADRGIKSRQKWNCPGCGRVFTRSSDLGRHNDSIHDRDEVYICNDDHCPHFCFRRDKMIEHCRDRHGKANKLNFTTESTEDGEGKKLKEQVQDKNAKCKECGRKKPTHRCRT